MGAAYLESPYRLSHSDEWRRIGGKLSATVMSERCVDEVCLYRGELDVMTGCGW